MAGLIVILAVAAVWIDVLAIRYLLQRASQQASGRVEPAPRAENLDHLLAQTLRELVALFDLRACWFEPFPFDTLLPRIEPGRIMVPAPEPGSPPVSYTSIELPVRLHDLTLGRIVLHPSAQSLRDVSSASARETAIAMAAALAAPIAVALKSGELTRSAR